MPYATSSSTTIIWNTWTDSTTVSTGTYDPWQEWVVNGTSFNTVTVNVTPAPPPTPEQLAAREAQRVATLAAEAKRREEQRVKRDKALQLLQGALTDEQVEELRDRGYFHVETQKGKRRYRFRPGSAPLRVLGEDRRQWSYCIHPDYGYPPEDVVLAQKLLLETDEEAFLRIANASVTRVAA